MRARGDIRNLIPKGVCVVTPTSTTPDTITRPKRIDQLDPFNAALAVGEFIGAPQEYGCWEITPFFINKQELIADYMRAHGDGKGRWSQGLGEFIKLHQAHDGSGPEGRPSSELWMTNTPREIMDHTPAFERATGRVLVHGLGLSCLISGLLAKPDVTHIDIVEIEKDVISLIGPAYEQENRVTIHQGNCIDYPWPSGTHWDYVWHDIWATISANNLTDPDLSEGGITYEMLHRSFGGRCTAQDSWAFERAQAQRQQQIAMIQKRERFHDKWKSSSEERRIDMLIDRHVNSQLRVPGLIEPLSREDYIEVLQIGVGDSLKALYLAATYDQPPFMFDDYS